MAPRNWILACALVSMTACGGGGGGDSGGGDPAARDSRPFRMGFTNWPYAATPEAIDWVWQRISVEGDVINHHVDEGVPWPAAAADEPFAAGFPAAIADRVARTPDGAAAVLAVTPLNVARDGLAHYRGETANEPLPAAWSGKQLDDVDVIDAYGTYVLRLVDELDPDWLLIGIEVNLLQRAGIDQWERYVALHQAVYERVKLAHPGLPVGASFVGTAYLAGYGPDDIDQQRRELAELEPWLDVVAWSLHPFMSSYLADSLPATFFPELVALTDLPQAVAESSYPAQRFSLEIDGSEVVFDGTPAKQADFTRRLLRAADDAEMLFVIWFTVRDYDELWAHELGMSDLALIWRDTGLYAGDGAERPALAVWRDWLALPYRRPLAPDAASTAPVLAPSGGG